MSVGKKLNATFFLMIFLLCIVVGITFINLGNIEEKTEEALDNRVEQIRTADQIRFDLAMQGLYARALMIDGSKQNEDNLALYQKSLDEDIVYLKKLARSEIMQQYLGDMVKFNDNFNTYAEQMLDAYHADNTNLATQIVNTTLQEANVGILETTNKIVKYQEKRLAIISDETSAIVTSSKTISIIVLVISILVVIALIIYVRRTITKPLNLVVQEANIIADGDL
mgnify:CR=1 FL=1